MSSSSQPYERVTKGIRVAVKPAYLEDQSEPDEGKYLWSYTITIENRG
jgi:ApaG protein